MEDMGCSQGQFFLPEKHLGANFLLLTNSKGGVGTSQIGVICEKEKRKLHIACFCFAPKQECCRIQFTPFLECNGFCIPQLKGIYCIHMALMWVKNGSMQA